MAALVLYTGPCELDVTRKVRGTLVRLRGAVGVPDEVIDDLMLVTTELVTNAIRAGSRFIDVELTVR